MNEDISKQLVEFTYKTKYEDLPVNVIEYAKFLLLKTVAGILAGSIKPSGRKMADLIQSKKLPAESCVIGRDFRTSLWEAVFLNSFFSHASELEDDRVDEKGGISWDIALIPLLLPVAEKYGISGKKLLEALAVCLEVHVRTCQFNPGHLAQTVVPGAIGPAAGAAKAMGLSHEQLSNAIGLAMSAPPLWLGSYATDAHFFESSLSCMQGIMAAEMAQAGLTGNADMATFLMQYLGTDRVDPKKLVEDLGKRWMFTEICIKKYPVCFTMHRQIDMVIGLKKRFNLSFEDVESIEVHAQRSREEICNRPDPKNEGEIQFSFQHNLALAMLYGDIPMIHISPEGVDDPGLKEARKKVTFVPAYAATSTAAPIAAYYAPTVTGSPMQDPAQVVVKMKDGRVLKESQQVPIGHPKDPLKPDQIQALFDKFTRGISIRGDMARISGIVMNIEKQENVIELMNSLQGNA
jgi:2-methylcitrate dehydratase PrpD